MKFRMFVIFIFVSTSILGQNTFIKKIEREYNHTTYQVKEYNERLFILSAAICEGFTECSLVLEIDSVGDIIWLQELEWLDVAAKSMVIQNDTIYLSGNHASEQKWLWHKMSVNGGDSLATYDVFQEEYPFERMFNLGQVAYRDRFCLYGTGRNGDIDESVYYFVDNAGKLDTQIILWPAQNLSIPFEVIPDNDGNLLSFVMYQLESENNRRSILRIDSNLTITEFYHSEPDQQNYVVPNGAVLHNGDVVYNTDNETIGGKPQSIRAIRPDGTIRWKYFSPMGFTLERSFFKIQTLRDGSILGTGVWGELDNSPEIRSAPWIIKISDTGQLIWEHVFYDIAPGEDRARNGFFYDAVELDDGSFIAVGNTRDDNQSPQQILIARLDSEGCLIEDCPVLNDVSDILNDAEDVEWTNKTILYPNPVVNILTIKSDHIPEQVDIRSIDGTPHMTRSNTNEIDVSNLAKGIYFIRIQSQGKEEVLKFVKG